MIVCISANPAIDRRVRVRNFRLGEVNRAISVEPFAGGKAAHVAMAARAMGEEVKWVGFLGGASGDEIERRLREQGIDVMTVRTESLTRTNDEIIDGDGKITEILEPGANISMEELEQMYDACKRVFADAGPGFQAVFSGSLPANVPDDFYYKLILEARQRGGTTILDTSGDAFLKGLAAEPDLIKPNGEEAENAVQLEIKNERNALTAVRRLRESGARSVALSLGAKGILWANGNAEEAILATPPEVKVVSTVGCGDATVAGFAVAGRRGWNELAALRLAAACGAANCLAEIPGQVRAEDVERILPLVSLRTIDG